MRWLLALCLALAPAVCAQAQPLPWSVQTPGPQPGGQPLSGAPFTICTPLDNPLIDDGCDALNAAGHIGLYTVNGQNSSDTADGCNLTPNCFFTYARQSGQAEYYNASAVQSNHPISFNQPGGDYGIGPWTPQASMWLASAGPPGGWSGVAGASCSYSSTNHEVTCALTAPNAITGYITAGTPSTLTVSTGTNPTVGQFVYYNVPVGGTSTLVTPYQITGGSAGVYTLASNLGGAAPNTGSSGSPVNLKTATVLNINGGYWDDIFLNLTGAGLFEAQNNEFIIGTNVCTRLSGDGPIFAAAAGTAISGDWILNNYLGFDSTCSGDAVLYPTYGATQATFSGTTSGTTLSVSGVTGNIAIGQYVNGAGFTSTTQILSGSGSSWVLSNSEPSLSETMTTGPIQTTAETLATFNAGASSGGQYEVVEYNYGDKVDGTMVVTSGVGPIYCKYNYDEAIGNPTNHINGCAPTQPGDSITSLTTGDIYTSSVYLQDANTILVDKQSIAGTQNGCATGTCAEGGFTGLLSYFATSNEQNQSGGAYMTAANVEIKNNILIANYSFNNNGSSGGFYPGTKATTASQGFYVDTQGATNPGPFPGSVQSTTISGNFFDPIGAAGCLLVSQYVFTTPGGSTTLQSVLTGTLGSNLLDGSVVNSTTCNGANLVGDANDVFRRWEALPANDNEERTQRWAA